jgi:hypothetical protein
MTKISTKNEMPDRGGFMRVLRGNENFRITGAGFPTNEYRISEESVEFRSLNLDGCAFTSLNNGWRVLDADEVQLHFALRTPVAAWLHQAGFKTN